MEELVICKICKKVFTDVTQLTRHRMATHPTSLSVQENNGLGQFRNNGSLSITRIHKETSGPPTSGMFRKQPAASINQRRAEMKLRGEQARVKPPFKSPDARIKGAQASLKQMVMGRQQEVDDTTTDWQKWEPPVSRDRPLPGPSRGQLTSAAIKMAVTAVPVGGSRKTVPPLLPMSRTKPAPPPTRPGSSAVAEIMKNLGKMKSMNKQPAAKPPQKLISLPKPPTSQKAKSPAAPKKAPPPKKSSPPSPQKRAAPPPEEDESSSEPELTQSPPKKVAPPPKPSPPPPVAKSKGGKGGGNDRVKMLKAYLPVMPGTDYDMPKLSAIGSYTNRQGQQVWVCLVCNEREHEESSQDMICCEWCEDWYHFDCVGIPTGDGAMKEDDPWYCKRCIFNSSSNAKKDFPKLFKNDVFD